MKLLFDNNLSVKLTNVVAELFPASRHVFDLNLHLHSDKQVFDFAGNHDYTIVTKDKDFYHLVNTFGAPPKVIWITIGNCSNQQVLALLVEKAEMIRVFNKSNRSLLIIQ